MKLFLLMMGLGLSSHANTELKPVETPIVTSKKVILGVIDKSTKSDFESKLLPVLQAQIARCKDCEVQNLSPYNEKGEFVSDRLAEVLSGPAKNAKVILANWNEKVSDNNKALVEKFSALSGQGIAIISCTGAPASEEPSAPLMRTIFGQVPNAFIIGELEERDKLQKYGFYGPQMLTALRPPREFQGKGLSPAFFAARLTARWEKRQDWVEHLHLKKQKSRKIWLDLDDLFGRE